MLSHQQHSSDMIQIAQMVSVDARTHAHARTRTHTHRFEERTIERLAIFIFGFRKKFDWQGFGIQIWHALQEDSNIGTE